MFLGRASAFGAALMVAAASFSAARAEMRAQTPQDYGWKELAKLEHVDRVRRFKRLASQSFSARPELYEYLIKSNDLPLFGIDLPVLRVVFSQRVFFDTDRDDVRQEAEAVLDLISENLKRDTPDLALFVVGHTDSRGGDAYNLALSVRRAENVAKALRLRNLAHINVWRIGFGKAVPLKPNTSPDNMASNRRVEFLLAAKPEAAAVWLRMQTALICSNAPEKERRQCIAQIDRQSSYVAVPVLPSKVEAPGTAPQTSVAVDAVPPTIIGSEAPPSALPIEKTTPVRIILDYKPVVIVGSPLQ